MRKRRPPFRIQPRRLTSGNPSRYCSPGYVSAKPSMNCVTTSAPQKSKPIRFPGISRGLPKQPENSTRTRRKRRRRTVGIVDELLPPRRHGCPRVLTGSAGASPRTSREAKTRCGVLGSRRSVQHRCFSGAPRPAGESGVVALCLVAVVARWRQVFGRVGVMILRWRPSADNSI